MLALVPWVVAGAVVARLIVGSGSRRTAYTEPPPEYQGVPFAQGDPAPVWPLVSKRPRTVSYRDTHGEIHGSAGRRFMAPRPSGAASPNRYHVGIDLYANAGDLVLAPEGGVVVGTQPFLPGIPGEDALLIRGDNGVTVLLGEMAAQSWKAFGVHDGSRVVKGQRVGRVGLTQSGNHMLHIETYLCCPTKNESWYIGKPRPEHVLDPTDYLLRAAAAPPPSIT